jgi:ubiquinone biosynthesis protein
MLQKIPTIGNSYRHIVRYSEIIGVFIKYGFEDIISSLKLKKFKKYEIKKEKGIDAHLLSRGERLCMALTELGPTFIKFGQFLSNRPDILPQEIIISLQKLLDSVKPFDVDIAKSIVEKELNKSINDVFCEFSDVAIASASIAQVHKAKLKDGSLVAVKIQRPNIEQIIEIDIEILFNLAFLAEKYIKEAKYFNPVRICEEFKESIFKELNFNNEALHIKKFLLFFKDEPTIKVPAVYKELSTSRILVIEYIEGIKVSDINKIKEAGLDPRLIAERGTNLILKQIFEFGFFHADPHPGNIVVLPDNVICFFDFGIMGIVSPSLKECLILILHGVVNKDPKRIIRAIIQMSQNHYYDMPKLEYDITELIEDYSLASIKEINIGELFQRLTRLVVTHRIKIMPGLYLLFKTLVTIEGVGYNLDPNFKIVKYIEPYAKKLILKQINPVEWIKEIYYSGKDIGNIFLELPLDIKDIINLIKNGNIRIEFKHSGLEPLLNTLDRLINRIVFALIITGLIVGSSLIVFSKIPPKIFDIPIIGIIGFLLAGIIGFWLIVSILFKKSM